MKTNKLAALLLCCAMLIGVLPSAAFAADGAYVLMNIPYAEFYASELGANGAPDAVSAAVTPSTLATSPFTAPKLQLPSAATESSL